MAASSTLADLYVNVTTNNSGLTSGLAKMQGQVAAAGAGLASTFMAALGPIGAALAGAFAIGEAISSFAEGEVAAERLAQAFGNAGVDVEANMAAFDRAAGEIMRLTTVGDEAVSELFRYGLALGVPAEGLENTTKAAIGLGRSLNLEPAMVMKSLAQEAQGYESKLGKLIPGLRGVTDQQERLRIIQEAAANGMADEQAFASTLTGQWARLQNVLGEVAEGVGGILSPALKFGADVLIEMGTAVQDWIGRVSEIFSSTENLGALFNRVWGVISSATGSYWSTIGEIVIEVLTNVMSMADTFAGYLIVAFDFAAQAWDIITQAAQNMWATIQPIFATMGAYIVGVANYIWSGITSAFSAIGAFIAPYVSYIAGLIEDVAFAFVNWDLTVKTVGISLAETWTNIVGRVRWLGENIGIFLQWLVTNWTDIWTTVVDYAATVFLNLVDNVVTIATNIGEIFSNMASNIKNIFSEVWDFITSWGEDPIDFKLVPLMKAQLKELTQGAQNYIKEMPAFTEFVPTSAFDDQKAEVAKEWDARRKAWDTVTREEPVAIAPEAVGLEVGDLTASGTGKGAKKDKKDDKAGNIQSLGSGLPHE